MPNSSLVVRINNKIEKVKICLLLFNSGSLIFMCVNVVNVGIKNYVVIRYGEVNFKKRQPNAPKVQIFCYPRGMN